MLIDSWSFNETLYRSCFHILTGIKLKLNIFRDVKEFLAMPNVMCNSFFVFFAPTYGNTVTVDWISKFDNFPEISDALHLNSKIFYNLVHF